MLKKEMKDNQKLKGLDGQMGEMRNDFEDMKRTREEARKQLEAKFQDIYKKLAALKEALETEAKRVNNSLKAFESKFLCLLNELKEELKKDMDDEKKFVRDKFAEHEKHMEEIEKKLEQEREERLKQNQDTLGNIQNRLTLLEEAQKQEKIDREEGEKEIIKNINDNVYEINTKLDREKDDRNTKIKIMNEKMEGELAKRDKCIADLQNKNTDEIPKEKDNNNENDIVNQLTPEQIQFIQQQLQMQEMQRQMMIQKYFLDNGWENNFINNYLLNIPAESEELDDGLPHAKNGIIQLDSDKPTLGLQNVGATCYMNATLECLIHMKELSQLLLSAFFFKYPRENKEYAEKHKLTLNYINLLSQVFFPKLNGNQSKNYAPYEFKAIISELNPLFQGVQANDAKDLLQCILENLHNELKMATQYFQEYNIDQRDEKASMQYFFNSYITQNKSPVQDFLYGINRIKSICLKCNTAKYNFQTYNLLYFPLKEAKRIAVLRKKKEDEKFDEKNYTLNLEDCFAHSEQVDHFTGDNQMYCNECQSCADAEYQTVLYTTPTILSIVLNRGKANLDFQEKFEFGLDLDIKKYIYNPEAKHGKYYLIGMVVHSGEHGMGGHFIAYCRMDKKAKWFCYNDAWVTECNDIEKKLSENSPYILFYHYDNDFNNDNK